MGGHFARATEVPRSDVYDWLSHEEKDDGDRPSLARLKLPSLNLPGLSAIHHEDSDKPKPIPKTDTDGKDEPKGFSARAELDKIEKAKQDAKDALNDGNDLMAEERYAEALSQYEGLLEQQPENRNLLWNAGLAALLSGHTASAVTYLQRLKTLEPTAGRVRYKLVQAYQAEGLLDERDNERAELLRLHETTTLEAFKNRKTYCRDQFKVNGQRVWVFEHFDTADGTDARYDFIALDENGTQTQLSLRAHAFSSWVAQELNMLLPGEIIFQLESVNATPQQAGAASTTYALFEREPSYDLVRQEAFKAFNGKSLPVSSAAYPELPTAPSALDTSK